MQTIKSGFLKLNSYDIVKGLEVAILSAVLTTVVQMLSTGFNFKQLGLIALTTGISYLAKNLLTNSDNKFAGVVQN